MPTREDMTKRLPSLAEHLGENPRAEGFEQWITASFDSRPDTLTADEEMWLRLARTFGIACVEQMNREAEIDRSPEGIARALSMWSRVAGFITITAVASVARDDAPFRKLARTFSEDFKIGAKMGADALLAQHSGAADVV